MPQSVEYLSGGDEIGSPQGRSSESMRSGFNRSEKIAAVTAFEPILGCLDVISNPRRAQGKRFEQRSVLLFAILAIVTPGLTHTAVWEKDGKVCMCVRSKAPSFFWGCCACSRLRLGPRR
jgi:hypothetical protein